MPPKTSSNSLRVSPLAPLNAIARHIDAESGAAVVVRPDRRTLERYRANLRRFDAMLERSAARAGARIWNFDADWDTGRLIRQTAAELFRGGDR